MERLKELRIKHGLLQKEVAKKIGVDRTTYVKYEKGSSDPNFKILQRLADYFNVTIDYLLGYKGRSEMSDLFKHSLFKTLKWIDNYGDLTEPEAQADYIEAMGYAKSQYVLTIDEIFRASDLVGESIDDMLSEDFEPGIRESIKIPPNEEKTELSDAELKLLSLYRDLNLEGQEKLLDYADDLVSSGKYIKSDPYELGEPQEA